MTTVRIATGFVGFLVILAHASPWVIPATAAHAAAVWVAGLLAILALRRSEAGVRLRVPLAAIAGILTLLTLVPLLRGPRSAWTATGPELTVVSYNLLFKGSDVEKTLALLREHPADVLLLQEITPAWARRLKAANLGGHRFIASHRGTHGMAIIARVPLTQQTTWDNRVGNTIAQCATLELAAPVDVCHVHLAAPAGALYETTVPKMLAAYEGNANQRAEEWEMLATAFEERNTMIVGGDFNTPPGEPLMRRIRRRWVDVGGEGQLFPGATFPKLNAGIKTGDLSGASLRDLGRSLLRRVAPATGPLVRIDYVLASPEVQVQHAQRLWGGGSDHYAVRAELRLP